jgi:hypothetical protein
VSLTLCGGHQFVLQKALSGHPASDEENTTQVMSVIDFSGPWFDFLVSLKPSHKTKTVKAIKLSYSVKRRDFLSIECWID